MEGSGRNVTEAKKNAGSKIEKALHDTYQPQLICEPGCDFRLIVFRSPLYGWSYQCTNEGRNTGHTGGFQDRNDAIRHARVHVAQVAWKHSDNDTFPYVENAQDKIFLQDWAHWQRRYKAFRDAGFTDQESYDSASNLSIEVPTK